MNKILTILLFLLSFNVLAQEYMLLPIISVYDGDTIKTDLTWRVPAPLNKISVRISGIDTPEMPAKSYATTGKLGRAKCVKEAGLALKAKAFVEKLANKHSKMKVEKFKYGKYAGRILGKVSIGGIDVAQALINNGFAVEYYGKGLKHNWCR